MSASFHSKRLGMYERYDTETHEILQHARDTMLSILRRIALIHAGLVVDGEFKDLGRGVPLSLLDSFKDTVAFVCALPRVLQDTSRIYKDSTAHECAKLKSLMSTKIRVQKRVLVKIGRTAEEELRNAERTLMSPTQTGEEETVSNGYVFSVGLHYMAATMVCNLLSLPISNRKKVSEIYDTIVKVQVSMRFPKRKSRSRICFQSAF